jgi:hypothetical protein
MAVFVIKPSDYAVPLDKETRLPRFSYIHQPEGTPPSLSRQQRAAAQIRRFCTDQTKGPRRFDAVLFESPAREPCRMISSR